MLTLAIGEDNLIQVGEVGDLVRDAADESTIADATITADLKSEDLATTIKSAIAIAATATDGIYQGVLPADAALVQDAYYWLEITISGTADGFRRIKCQARYHTEEP